MTRLFRVPFRVSPSRSRPRCTAIAGLVAAASLCSPAQLGAQDAVLQDPRLAQPPVQDAAVVDPPAHVSLVEGSVVLERDGTTDSAPGSMPLLAGDRLRTQNGRAEVLFSDNSTLHLDANTVVDFQSDEVVRLLGGRIRLNIAGPRRDVSYRVDAPAAWIEIAQPGEYRISVLGSERNTEVELAVVRGAAEIVNEDGRSQLRAGERAFARAGAGPSSPYVFNSAAWDAFDHWSEARRSERLGAAAEYLPEQVQPYATTFASYGSWQREPTYGYVWYPRVRSGWRPYYYGRWSHLRPYGWTWIGADPWAWPTHHYGRWGFSAGAWFWIPGPRWSPAWVSWGYAPGYVSWCPLGWNNRPVFGFGLNVFHGRRYDPWHGWTVLPHRRFGRGFVNINVVNVTNIDRRTRGAFVVRDRGPAVSGYAVPRSSAPIRVAGSRLRPGDGVAGSRSYSPGSRSASPDAGAAFRSRRGPGEPLNGGALPAPSREPRASVPLRSAPGENVAPSRRRAVPADEPAGDRATTERRAVPRGGVPSVPGDASRRAVPESRRAPSAPQSVPEVEAYRSPYRSRAVPRRSDESRPDGAPAPRQYSAPREYNRRAPSDSGRPSYDPGNGAGNRRAVPRAAPDGGGAPPSYRPSPGMERRAPSQARPSGPPPSARPSRPSGGAGGGDRSAAPPSNRGGGGDGSRSRGGQPSGGTAVRRPRG